MQKKSRTFEFVWVALNQQRATITGEIEAPSISQARVILRQRGLRVTKIKRKPKPLFSSNKKIKSVDISFASRQMATMIGAGIPISQTLRAIGEGHENPSMETLMKDLSRDIESGSALSSALGKYPQHFDQLFLSLTDAGEESGKLDTMLSRVADYNEKLQAIKSKVKSAMSYPIVVLVAALAVTVIMLIFVIPQFEELFKGSGTSLPTLTQVIVDLSKWLREKWYIPLVSGIIIIVTLSNLYKGSEKIKYSIDKILLKIPGLGIVLKKSALARFARTLAIIFSSGVPLVDGLRTVGASTGNRVYQKAVDNIKEDISTGRSLEASMVSTKVFPNMMLQMVASGEESGELEVMLDKVAEFYEREVDDAVAAMSSIIEPVMIVLLGGIIGTMVMAMYLPIFKLGSAL